MEKWDIVKDIFSFRERMNKFFEDTQLLFCETESPVWTPVIDMYETKDMIVVMAELPEISEKDVHIRVEGNILKIYGEKRPQREGRSYHQVERAFGAFSRSFVISSEIDKENIKATLKDGILKIVLPKNKADLPKHLEIT